MAHASHRGGRPLARAKSQMFAAYGDTCHLCGHPGGYEADHLTPLAIWPDQPVDYRLMRPAHGSNYPCPVCVWQGAPGKPCNQVRGVKPVDQQFVPRHDW
jgi:hypothetical protein